MIYELWNLLWIGISLLMKQLQWEVTRGKKSHGTLVPEPYYFIGLFLRKKIKFYMRGAESSKWFMSYEIYFELEYYYLWSNCNGWVRSTHNLYIVRKVLTKHWLIDDKYIYLSTPFFSLLSVFAFPSHKQWVDIILI